MAADPYNSPGADVSQERAGGRFLRCPHCKEKGFSLWKRLCIGPFKAKKCRRCRGLVTVSMKRATMVVIFHLIVVNGLLFFLGFRSYLLPISCVLAIIFIPLYSRFVPLMRF